MQVIVCSDVQWHFVRTRKQQIVRRLPADWSILFLQVYKRGRSNAWRPRREGNVTYVTIPVFKHIPDPLLRWVQDRGIVRAMWNLVLALWVWWVRRITGFGGGSAALYVSNIYYGRALRWMRRAAMIYDCNDNHLAFPGTPAWARGYFERVVRTADAVVVSAPILRELIEPLRQDAIVEIGNGVDFELFDAAYHAPESIPAMQALPRPRIGYAGVIAPWIDLELIAAVAQAMPEASIVLVGPAHAGVDPAAAFAACANVHLVGEVSHERLPHYVAGLDVTLIPFRRTPLTRGVNPNKLYEYMALGKPVVCTDFSPFIHEFAPLVRVADSVDQFVQAIRACLAQPPDREALREVARRNSWERAAARMAALIESLVAGRGVPASADEFSPPRAPGSRAASQVYFGPSS
jgi:glycosyltransferase involved in cell wall biosynthesis